MLADDPGVACVIVAVKRLCEPMHSSDIAVNFLSCCGILGVGILCKITVCVHYLLQIEYAVVAVLTVPQEVEQTDVMLTVRAVDPRRRRGGKHASDVIGRRKAAGKVVCIVWNSVGNLLTVQHI